MMIRKLLGVLLLIGVGAYSAHSISHFEKKRIKVLNGWLDLIYYIRTQIDCYLTPIEQIFLELSPSLLQDWAGVGKAKNPSSLLKHTQAYLDCESIRLLEGFIREIGAGYREEQIKRCDYYLTALQGIRDQQLSQLPARLRARSTLCICGAFGLAILLW